MPIYKGNNKIEFLYKGSQRIKELYKGSVLVYQLYAGQTSDTPGTTTIKIPSGTYRVTLIGGGGGGCGQGAKGTSYSAASGSAGAAYRCIINISKSMTLQYTVGGGGKGAGGGDYSGTAGTGGASSFSLDGKAQVTCTGGSGGQTWFRGGSYCGPGGTVTVNDNTYIQSADINVSNLRGTNGNTEGYYYQCQAPTSLGNYGKGGSAAGWSYSYKFYAENGNNGYFKIERWS